MTGAIQQGGRRLSPPQPSPAPDPARPLGVRHGHYAMTARLVGEFERAAERVLDLTEIPMPLLARFARVLQLAERNTLARVQAMEEATE